MMELRNSRFFAFFLSSALALILSACGGGGGTSDPGFIGGGVNDPDDPTDPGTGSSFSITLALTDDNGNAINTISSSTPGVLTVTLVPSGGATVAGVTVFLNTDIAAVLPSSGSRLTDDNGVAVFQLLASGSSGADVATASAGDAEASVSYQVDAQLSIILTDQDGNTITQVSEDEPGVITVTSSDSQGTPIVGDLITVSATAGQISPTTRLTNDQGRAIFALTPLADVGAGTVTAQSGNRSAAVSYEVIAVGGRTDRIEAALTDTAGNPVTNITDISPGVLTATATDENGLPLANVIVNGSVGLGIISPTSALTDLNGVAVFTITSDGTLGASTAEVSLFSVSDSINFQIGEANLRIGRIDGGGSFVEGEIDAGATSLPAAGSTPLTVTVVDDTDTPVSSPVQVNFISGCANLTPPLATISESVTTVNGLATSTYTAAGCTGTDNITAAIVGGSSAANTTLTIATAAVNSIAFVTAEPDSIALKGTGGAGRAESSNVSFQVLDNTGSPASGVNVDFSLSTTIGGLSLTNASATTDADGVAEAIVLAGNVSTSVRVTATIDDGGGNPLSTVSDQLVVSTGLPDQDSLSVGSDVLNPGGGNIDGITTTLTVRMADKFNNPVPDGTTAFFTTEYGAIEDSCALENGACTVTWNSQSPRFPLNVPGDPWVSTLDNRVCAITGGTTGSPCPDNLGNINGLRSQVVVIAVGEETFIDVNGNGLYDVGEPFQDLPEAFLDKNENNVFDNIAGLCTPDSSTEVGRACAEGQEEIFFDFNSNGVYDNGNGLYNGSLCPQALADANQCSRDLVHVRQDTTIVMSDTQRITLLDNATRLPIGGEITLPSGGPNVTLEVVVSDFYNNVPSAGTTVTVTADDCEVLGDPQTVPNTSSKGAYSGLFTLLNRDNNADRINGTITVTVEGSVGSEKAQLVIGCIDEIN